MKKIYFLFFLLFISTTTVTQLYSQNGTLYFIEGLPARSRLNPAFMPDSKWFLEVPVISGIHAEAGGNAFSVSDFLFNYNGKTVTALHPSQDADKFYNKVRKVNSLDTDMGINLLSIGIAGDNYDYFSLSAELRATGRANIPRDLFKLALYGTPVESGNNIFNLTKTGVESAIFSELVFGYSRELNEEFTVGGKLKYLKGYASAHSRNKNLQLSASQDEWLMEGDAEIYGSIPLDYQTKENGNIDFNSFSGWDNKKYQKLLRSPAGNGLAIDLGVVWKPVGPLTVSASLTDLGFIRWKNNLLMGSLHGIHSFTGIDYHKGDSINWERLGNEIEDAFEFSSSEGEPYSQRLTANMHIGAEYEINKQLSLGALSRTMMHTSHVSQEMTLAANYYPIHWFDAHLTYSFMNGGGNTLGLGARFRFGPVQAYFLTDYIPFSYAKLIYDNGQTTTVPFKNKRVNFQFGTVLTFGERK
ncbi:MAG: DUF5723 family protein [Fermentimonas sp.]|nr:DUF5723 family protein [Fermentimonas sp.]